MIVPLQPTNYYFNNALLALTDATPVVSLLTVPTLMLGTASITPNLGTLVADLVEATFVGYTRSAVIVWDLPSGRTSNNAHGEALSKLFRCTADPTPNQIFNLAVTDGVAGSGAGIPGRRRMEPSNPDRQPGRWVFGCDRLEPRECPGQSGRPRSFSDVAMELSILWVVPPSLCAGQGW